MPFVYLSGHWLQLGQHLICRVLLALLGPLVKDLIQDLDTCMLAKGMGPPFLWVNLLGKAKAQKAKMTEHISGLRSNALELGQGSKDLSPWAPVSFPLRCFQGELWVCPFLFYQDTSLLGGLQKGKPNGTPYIISFLLIIIVIVL